MTCTALLLCVVKSLACVPQRNVSTQCGSKFAILQQTWFKQSEDNDSGHHKLGCAKLPTRPTRLQLGFPQLYHATHSIRQTPTLSLGCKNPGCDQGSPLSSTKRVSKQFTPASTHLCSYFSSHRHHSVCKSHSKLLLNHCQSGVNESGESIPTPTLFRVQSRWFLANLSDRARSLATRINHPGFCQREKQQTHVFIWVLYGGPDLNTKIPPRDISLGPESGFQHHIPPLIRIHRSTLCRVLQTGKLSFFCA